MPTLDGSTRRVDVAAGVTVQAPGYRGEVIRLSPAGGGTRAPVRAAPKAPIAAAFEQADLTTVHEFSVDLRPVVGAGGQPTRAPGGADALVLSVPAPPPGQGQAALLVDPNGLVTWHFPQPDPAAVGRAQFVVPVEPTAPMGETPAEERGLFGVVVHKLLSVVVFPVVEELIGAAAEKVAAYWEGKHHPYLLRSFTVENFQAPSTAELDDAQWAALAGGPALLFVHGTFSSSAGGFGALPPDTLAALHHRYGGRVFAFDHPTLSVTPAQNVLELINRTRARTPLDVDVVAHSRGGLVARALDGGAGDPTPYRIRKLVFVGTPNKGTALADPNRLGALINRYTTLLNYVPDGPWSAVTDVLSGILTAVKVIGQGAIGGLPGLQAMNPSDGWLTGLGAGRASWPKYFGISADYEPSGGLQPLMRAVDLAADDAFKRAANDIVVPSDGVGRPRQADGFPIAEGDQLHFGAADGVWHCSYFSQPQVSEALLRWLDGAP